VQNEDKILPTDSNALVRVVDLPVADEIAKVAFTTRHGGVSTGVFGTANMAFHVGDRPEHVVENRRRACAATGMDHSRLVAGKQVHGDNVHVVSEDNAARGALEYDSAIDSTDALITQAVNVPIAVFVADCLPIAIVDVERRVLALVHAGWRGTAACIVSCAVHAMRDSFGSVPSGCWAVLGPRAGKCCYVVGSDVRDAFPPDLAATPGVFTQCGDETLLLDLGLANKTVLRDSGVAHDRIVDTSVCTICTSDYFSARRDGSKTGRNMMVAMLQ